MFHLSQRHNNDLIGFEIEKNNIYCLLCNCNMNCEEDLEKHLESVIHQNRMNILSSTDNGPRMHVSFDPTFVHNRYMYHFDYNSYYQNQTIIQNNFINDSLQQAPITAFEHIVFQNIQNLMEFCFVCNKKFEAETSLFSHFQYDYTHNYKLDTLKRLTYDKFMGFTNLSGYEIVKCLKCQVYFTELSAIRSHLLDNQHQMQRELDNEYLISNNSSYNRCESIENAYVCPVCKIKVLDDYLMAEHIKSSSHKCNVQAYYSNVNCESFEKIIFHCPACKMNFFGDNVFLDHFQENHKGLNIYKSEILTMKEDAQLINSNLQNDDSLNQIKVENKFSNRESDITNSCVKTYAVEKIGIFKRCNSKERSNKIYSNPNLKYKNSTIKYIGFNPTHIKLFAETGKESIFTTIPNRIKNLELGIALTVPFNSNRCCIPCGIEISSDLQYFYEHLRSSFHEKNIQEMQENDKIFEMYPNQFSDLRLAKSYLYEDSDECVKCLACDSSLRNDDESISFHINSQLHVNKSQFLKQRSDHIFNTFNHIFNNLWFYIDKYFCNICCSQFDCEMDYARHLESDQHLLEVDKRIMKNQSLEFDCCIICSSYWFSKADHHAVHCNKDSHKYILKSRSFTEPEIDKVVKDSLVNVDEVINSLVKKSDEAMQTNKDNEIEILRSMEISVKSKYPNVKAYLFGSRISNLCFQNSNLDIYLDCNSSYTNGMDAEKSRKQLMLNVQECVFKLQDIWSIEEIIPLAKLPLMKLRHRATDMNCDISFLNGLSVEKSRILRLYVKAYHPCRQLILFLKKWNVGCQLAVSSGITTHAMSWLVIFFLQIKKVFPSVSDLMKLKKSSKIVAGWETGTSTEINVSDINLPFKELLHGFFTYYAEFDYISDVACPFLGKAIKKTRFCNIENLPEEMNIYKCHVKEKKVPLFRFDSAMCIQEPIDLSENITNAVTKLHLRIFKQSCVASAKILSETN